MAKIEYNFQGLESTIEFEFPAVKRELPQIKPLEKVVESVTGERYTTHYANIHIQPQTFELLTEQFIETVLRPFFRDHAILRRPFKYFQDKDSESFEVVTLEKAEFIPKRHSRVPDRYDISFTFRWIVETLPATNIVDTDNTFLLDDNGQISFFLIEDGEEKFVMQYEEVTP